MKLFVPASPEVRAHRRWLELTAAGHELTEAAVLNDVRDRDARDASRKDAPMRPADDAVMFDTSSLGIDEALAEAVTLVRKRREKDA